MTVESKKGANLPKAEEAKNGNLPVVKMAGANGNRIAAMRELNGLLAHRLDNLDKLYDTQDKVKAFEPENPEVSIGLKIEDKDGNVFFTANPVLIRKALQVVNAEVASIISNKEAEVLEMAS